MLDQDNLIHGRFLAELTREVFADLEASKYQHTGEAQGAGLGRRVGGRGQLAPPPHTHHPTHPPTTHPPTTHRPVRRVSHLSLRAQASGVGHAGGVGGAEPPALGQQRVDDPGALCRSAGSGCVCARSYAWGLQGVGQGRPAAAARRSSRAPPPPKHTHAPHLPPTRTRTRTPSPCLLRTRQQVPRLYNVYKEQGIIENFEQARARRSPRFACPPPHACWPAALLPPPAHPLPLLLPLPSLRCPRHAIPPACLPARPPTHLPPRCAGVQLLDNIFTPLALCTALVTNQPTPRRPLAQLLDNIFTPLFEVTADPSSHPQLHLFLRTVGGGAWVGGRAGG